MNATDLYQLLLQLSQDAREAVVAGRKDRGLARRAAVRSIFAFVEGACFAFRQFALEISELEGIPLSLADTVCLREESFSVDDKGNATTRLTFPRLEDSIKFSLRAVARVVGKEAALDLGGEDWARFLRAIKLRHRLTHPKSGADLSVTDQEFNDADDALNWFATTLSKNVEVIKAALSERGYPPPEWPPRFLTAGGVA